MINNDEQQVLALASAIQALSSIVDVASSGEFDDYAAVPIFQSLISYNPEDTLTALGGNISTLQQGLRQLQKLLSDSINRDIAQYLLAVVAIELKLVNNPKMRHILQGNLQQISNDVLHATQEDSDDFQSQNNVDDDAILDSTTSPDHLEKLTSSVTIEALADTYKQTASQIEPRIMIKGSHDYLQNENHANQIRALLLGALRGAAFFRHYGGKRVDFMLKRKQYIAIAKNWMQ